MRRTLRRRRLEAKTDYRARIDLLKSEKPRLVIRKTNKYIIAQIIESHLAQDKVIIGVTSKDLLSKGWPKEFSGSLKSIPAAYLTGLLLGKVAKGRVKEAVLDIGLNRNIQKSRLYSALNGVVDAGLIVPHSKEALPNIEEISSNPKITKVFNKIKQEL